MNALLKTLSSCKQTSLFADLIPTLNLDWQKDMSRLFWLRQRLIWVPYERYEFTRLSSIRADMDLHKSYKKEEMLGKEDDQS